MTPDQLAAELDLILSEDVPGALRRVEDGTQELHRRIAASGIVLHGAGGMGRRVLGVLRAAGLQPLAFADSDPRKQGTAIDGVPVLARQAALASFPAALGGVCVWGAAISHRYVQTADELRAAGVADPISFPRLLALAPGGLPFYAAALPDRVLGQAREVRRAARLMADADSRRVFLGNLRWRAGWDFSALPRAAGGVEYFPDDLVAWGEERFLDGGAFDGDTLRALLGLPAATLAAALACEPDPANHARLAAWHAGLGPELAGRIRCERVALADHVGELRFCGDGTMASSHSAAGDLRVACSTIDGIAAGFRPTMIKLDIEGAEPEALAGAGATLARHRPVLAVCAYHRPDHLWLLPNLIAGMVADYTFHLRPYHDELWDLVLYAVPRERARRPA